MAGDTNSETATEQLSTTVNFIKNVECWNDIEVDGDMPELLVRAEALRNRCIIGLKQVGKNIHLKKTGIMESVKTMGKELEETLRRS